MDDVKSQIRTFCQEMNKQYMLHDSHMIVEVENQNSCGYADILFVTAHQFWPNSEELNYDGRKGVPTTAQTKPEAVHIATSEMSAKRVRFADFWIGKPEDKTMLLKQMRRLRYEKTKTGLTATAKSPDCQDDMVIALIMSMLWTRFWLRMQELNSSKGKRHKLMVGASGAKQSGEFLHMPSLYRKM